MAPPAEWPIKIGGRSSPPITSARWSTTAGTVRFSIGVGSAFSASTSTSKPRVGRGGDHAVALLLVVGLLVLPAARSHPEAVDQNDRVEVRRLPQCSSMMMLPLLDATPWQPRDQARSVGRDP
jgi:hypothetical protein